MPQKPKSLQPRSRFKVLTSLWKSIDAKTDRLMPLLDLLEWMKRGPSDLGEKFLEALMLLNEELRMNRELRKLQMDAQEASAAQQATLEERLTALENGQMRMEKKLDALLKTLQIRMK